jgi:hypothetical protein
LQVPSQDQAPGLLGSISCVNEWRFFFHLEVTTKHPHRYCCYRLGEKTDKRWLVESSSVRVFRIARRTVCLGWRKIFRKNPVTILKLPFTYSKHRDLLRYFYLRHGVVSRTHNNTPNPHILQRVYPSIQETSFLCTTEKAINTKRRP